MCFRVGVRIIEFLSKKEFFVLFLYNEFQFNCRYV